MPFDHVAVYTAALDAALDFYTAFGLDRTDSFTIDGREYVSVGTPDNAVQLVADPDAPDPTPDRTALEHLAVSVDDVDATHERLVEETDRPVVQEPTAVEAANARVSFVEDPDGYVVELIERPA